MPLIDQYQILPYATEVLAGAFFSLTLPHMSSSLFFRTSLLAPYKAEYEYAMVPQWGGDNYTALTSSVVRLAEKIIEEYGTTEHLHEVGPGKDGSLSFVWDDEEGRYIYLDVGPNDTVHLYYDIDGEKWEGVSIASDPRILKHLADAFSRCGWSAVRLTYRAVIPSQSNRARYWQSA